MNKFKTSILSLIVFPLIGYTQNHNQSSNIDILDGDKDGIINPYEALDILLLLQKKNGNELTLESFSTIASKYKKDQEKETTEIFKEFDKNNDGTLKLKEVDGDMAHVFKMMDVDNNKEVSFNEMNDFDFADAFLASDEEINEHIEDLFEKINIIDISKSKKNDHNKYSEWDYNQDGKVTKTEAYNFMKADNSPVSFTVKGEIAYMTGVITAKTPATILQLLFEHPLITTIEMLNVPGSIDDVANLRASLYVNKFGLTTKLNARSSVASGGTDFFLAGKQRIVEQGAKIGVHSWAGGSVAATELPKSDEAHQKYLDYYNIVGIPAGFYWYTLKAAPADDIHLMTEEEIILYKIRKTNIARAK